MGKTASTTTTTTTTMSSHATRLVITTIITSLLSTACFIVGYFVNVWWIIDKDGIKTTVGLWKTCNDYQNGTEICEDRADLLSFKNEKGTCFNYFSIILFFISALAKTSCFVTFIENKHICKSSFMSFFI